MNRPAPRGLSAIATYLRNLATIGHYQDRADHFHHMAAQIDSADRELRHLRALSTRIRDCSTPEDLQFLIDVDEDWRRTQAKIDAELASGA